MANLSVDEIIRIGKEKGVDMSKYEQPLRQKFSQTGVPTDSFKSTKETQPLQTQSSDVNSLMATLMKPKSAFDRGLQPSIDYNRRMAGEKVEPTEDYSKLYAQEAIKNLPQFKDQEGFATEGEIPQQMNGLPVKSMTYKNGRWVPTYGVEKPLVQFGDIGNMVEDINNPTDEQISSGEIPDEPTQEQSGMSIEQLDQMKQSALDEGRDPQEVEQIYQEELGKIQGGIGTDLLGDVSEFNIDESDRQYLLSQGFDPEMVDNVLSKAIARKGGQNGQQ
jgi:hypothetical protein